MGIDKYETLEQIHNAMGYMQGTWQPPAAEDEDVGEDEDEDFERIGDGDEDIEQPIAGIGDGETGDGEGGEGTGGGETTETDFESLLAEALANQDSNFQTELANALQGQADSYATDLKNALAAQQAGYDSQLSVKNSAMSSYQDQMKLMNEEALRAQEQMRIQAAYGDPGRVTGAQVVGVSEADDDDQLVTLGATGSYNRDGLRISSLNI